MGKSEVKQMCAYYAKCFPQTEMQQVLGSEYGNWYCKKCFPQVLREHWKLPWNRK